MDAMALLDQVSEVYRKLRSLAAESTSISESGDEDASQRSEHRVQFFFVAPNRMRFEPMGNRGVLQVCDGTNVHTFFRRAGPAMRPRYTSMPVNAEHLPHRFRPELPVGTGNEPFLFGDINAGVREAELLPDEADCRVVSVTYEPGPHTRIQTSPIRFHIDPQTLLVMRVRTDVGHRHPTEDDVHWTRHTLIFRSLRMDEAIPDSTFRFTPPAEAVGMAGGRGFVGGSGGGGFIRPDAEGRGGYEHRSTHEWEGETLVEHSRWKMRGMMLTFERRITFDGDYGVEIVERATGPKGVAEMRCSLEAG